MCATGWAHGGLMLGGEQQSGASIPAGLAVIVLVGTPLLAFAGVFIGHLVTRRGARELEKWRRREEAMRTARWAAEQAVSGNEATQRMGIAALDALEGSELLQAEDRAFVEAVTDAVLAPSEEQVGEAMAVEDVEVEVDTGDEEAGHERASDG